MSASTSATTLSEARRRIFESVFPPNISASLPTPLATPSSSFVPPPTPTRHSTRLNPNPPAHGVSLLPSQAAVAQKQTRAWHLATSFLTFPDAPLPGTVREWIEARGPPPKDAIEAIRYLVLNYEDGNVEGRENLQEWYVCEVRRHFLGWVKPACRIPENIEDPPALLERILKMLTAAQSIYLYQFRVYLLPTFGEASPRKTPRRSTKKKPAEKEVDMNDPRIRAFIRSLNSIISFSLPDPAWSELVYTVLVDLCGLAVGINPDGEELESDEETETGDEMTDMDDSIYDKLPDSFLTETDLDGDSILVADDDGDILIPEKLDGIPDFEAYKQQPKGPRAEARRKVLKIWGAMEKLGIGGGGRRGERVFAEIINTLITAYIEQSFAGRWESPSSAGKELEEWVEAVLARLIEDVLFSSAVTDPDGDARLEKLSPRESLRASRESQDKRRRGGMDLDDGAGAGEEEQKRRKEDLESWKKIAIGRLGRLRVKELFDIVVEWPHSLGGVEDLKAYITTPQTRQHLTTTFSAALSQRILHPAAATTDVLTAYIRLVRAFTVLDPRGVILDRVSRQIRRYLRDRDDTIKTVTNGIMSESVIRDKDATPSSEEEDLLSELAKELGKGIPSLMDSSGGLEELDFEDMQWVPDPVDVGPEFRRSKGLDVVGSLLSLFETKDVWVKQMQGVLTTKLLSAPTYEFPTEIRTVELLRLRFGDAWTQAYNVMLKDMQDSKRADALIRESQNMGQYYPEFHSKILSRMYWPQPTESSEKFRPPKPVAIAMKRYEKGFSQLKKKRLLSWDATKGQVDMQVELSDRVLRIDDATPAAAAVIYAFHTEDDPNAPLHDKPVTRTFTQLQESLEMSSPLLTESLRFLVSRTVLVESAPGEYTVLETRPSQSQAAQAAQHQRPAGENIEAIDRQKREEQFLVAQFIVGMLTNGGPMPMERIRGMLAMLVPGGFRWSSEQLLEFLGEMKEQRRIEPGVGGWRVVARQ